MYSPLSSTTVTQREAFNFKIEVSLKFFRKCLQLVFPNVHSLQKCSDDSQNLKSGFVKSSV